MRPVNNLLSRLDCVKETTNGQWVACCPNGHKSQSPKSPKLGIKETDTGQVLINCIAGCDPLHVLETLGLDWKDLYPESTKPELKAHFRETLSNRDLLKIIKHNAMMLEIGASDLLKHRQLSNEDVKQLIGASKKTVWAMNKLMEAK